MHRPGERDEHAERQRRLNQRGQGEEIDQPERQRSAEADQRARDGERADGSAEIRRRVDIALEGEARDRQTREESQAGQRVAGVASGGVGYVLPHAPLVSAFPLPVKRFAFPHDCSITPGHS